MPITGCELFPLGATEYIKGLEEELDTESGTFTAARCFDVPWIDRFNFVAHFLPIFTSNQNTPTLNRLYPAFPSAVAYRYQLLERLGIPGQVGPQEKFIDENNEELFPRQIGYDKCRLKIYYKADGVFFSAAQNHENDPTAPIQIRFELSLDSNVELLSLDGRDVIGGDNKIKAGKKFNIPIAIYSFEVHYPEINFPNFSSILNNNAKINQNTIHFIDNAGITQASFEPGKLRYDGLKAVSRISLDGSQARLSWDISHIFSYNLYRWDKRIKRASFTDFTNTPYNFEFEDIRLNPYTQDNFAFIPHFSVS